MNRHAQTPTPVSRLRVVTLAVALLVAIVITTARAGERHDREIGYGQVRFDGAGPERWARRWRREHRQLLAVRAELRRQRRVLLADPHVVEAINLACATYGYCQTLWRKARCETGGTFSARTRNASSGASGLYQFVPSTFASTPFAPFSIWSPYASALAAGWMLAHGRDEWACR